MTHARLHLDAYFTVDTWMADVVLSRVWLPGRVWEPACGAGHLCRALAGRGYDVVASDIFDWGWPCTVRDFMAWDRAPDGVRTIFTNPPFRRDIAPKFVRHALALMAPVGGVVCMLLPCAWHTARRRADLFSVDSAFDQMIVMTRRPLWFLTKGSKDPKKNFAWYVWSPAGHGRLGRMEVV